MSLIFIKGYGKSPCDGIGGTVKRLETRASLHKTIKYHILTPLQLFEFCTKNIHNIKSIYFTVNDWESENDLLKIRHQSVKTIPGTRKCHSFAPLSEHEVKVKPFSFCDSFTIAEVVKYIPKSPLKISTGN